MFGKICEIKHYDESIEGILLDITQSGSELLTSMIYIDEKTLSKKLRFGFFYMNEKDVSKIKVLDKSFLPYFELIFSGQVDHDDLYTLRTEWK